MVSQSFRIPPPSKYYDIERWGILSSSHLTALLWSRAERCIFDLENWPEAIAFHFQISKDPENNGHGTRPAPMNGEEGTSARDSATRNDRG